MSANPRRCFIGDLNYSNATLQQENEGKAFGTTTSTNSPRSCAADTRIRVMGQLVSIALVTEENTCADHSGYCQRSRKPTSEPSKHGAYEFKLDDGTGTIDVYVTRHMYQSISVEVGQTIDCIARRNFKRNTQPLHRKQPEDRQNCWCAETIIVVTDPNAETLRWIELDYASRSKPKPNETLQFGYPCFRVNADEVYRFILNQATIDNGQDAGISSEDLALVLQRPINEIRGMIQELQLSGQIYQNEDGLFVPL